MKKIKKIMIGIGALVIICVAMMLVCDRIVVNNAEGKAFSEIDSIKYNKVGLLLGTTPQARITKVKNYFFIYRLDAAEQLYRAGKIEMILISGDEHSLDGINETECMRDSLVERGIPAEDIYLDGKGYRTINSVINANKVFGLKSFTIISQEFHNERALYQAEHLGLDVENLQAFNAKMPTSRRAYLTSIREYFARVKMFLDIWSYKPNKDNQAFQTISDTRAGSLMLAMMRNNDLTLFGVSMKGTNLDIIINNLIDQTDEFDYFNEERQDIKRVMFCGVPCGLNIHSSSQDDSIFISHITLFTSHEDKTTFEKFKNGIVKRYGSPNIDEDQDVIEGVYYGRCKWTKGGVLLRHVNSEEGGLLCILESHIGT